MIPDNRESQILHEIYVNSKLNKALEYENISLLCFNRTKIDSLVKNFFKHTLHESDNETVSKNTPSVVFKIFKYYFLLRSIITYFLAKLFGQVVKKNITSSNKHNILIFSYENYWNKYPSFKATNTNNRNSDSIFGNIIDRLKVENFNLAAIYCNDSYFIDIKSMLNRNIENAGLWKPIEAYLLYGILKKVFNESKNYSTKWDMLERNYDSLSFLNSYNVKLSNILIPYLKNYFKNNSLISLSYIELCKKAIDMEKPDLILLTCGYCDFGKAALIAGKLKGIPTLEIQHGVISPSHPGYIFSKEDPFHLTIPDKTAVYGYYDKEVLTKIGSYPEDTVVVTGQPRYDFLSEANLIYSKSNLTTKYKINRNNKVILWTTQCHGISIDENVKNLETIFETMTKFNNVTLIVKQHPREGRKYTNMINKYLKKYDGINVVITPKNSNTFEQLFLCDLLITKNSTTAVEAIGLNKPVIILNLSGDPDNINYVEEGVALGVYEDKSLESTIKKVLDPKYDCSHSRELFINKYLYKLDGKSSERVVQLIKNTINEY